MTGGTLPLMIAPWTPPLAPVYPAKKQALTPPPLLVGPSTLRQGAQLYIDVNTMMAAGDIVKNVVGWDWHNTWTKGPLVCQLMQQLPAQKNKLSSALEGLPAGHQLSITSRRSAEGGQLVGWDYKDGDRSLGKAFVHFKEGLFTILPEETHLPSALRQEEQGVWQRTLAAFPPNAWHEVTAERFEEATDTMVQLIRALGGGHHA